MSGTQFVIPTLTQLRQQARAFFAARLPGVDTSQPLNRVTVTADNMAGLTYGEYGYLQFMAQQLFLSTASGTYLERDCNELGITRKAASTAAGTAVFLGINGLSVPSGTLLTASDGVTQFSTQAVATFDSTGTATVAIVAVTAGSAGNLAAGAALTLAVGIAGVQGTAAVGSGGTTGGADQESDDSLRARGLARKQKPPQGGSANDWWEWTLAGPNATRAWVFPKNRGAGTVDVCFVIDGRSNIAPLSADLTAMQTYLSPLAPVCADWQVFAPILDPINISITGLQPPSAQTAVRAALADLFASTTVAGAATGSGLNAYLTAGEVQLQAIETAIATAGGPQAFDLASPTADYFAAHGHMPVLGTVTFS